MTPALPIPIATHAPIPTWFQVGGGASRLARPTTLDELRLCLAIDPGLRVLGEGANLLVDDDGVDDLVVSLAQGDFVRMNRIHDDADTALLRVGAGVNLFKLLNATVQDGLAGIEVLAGIPASVGGAIVMNAGGAFGQIADVVERVIALDPRAPGAGPIILERKDIAFSYRHSGLNRLLITGAELRLRKADPVALAARKKDINDYKLRTQPMSASSAGCCFKNPIAPHALRDSEGRDIAPAGQRVSAGLLIDRAGLKGLRHGTAMVSPQHANFLIVQDTRTGKARDVIELMDLVAGRVLDTFGVTLEREVVVWRK